MTNPEKLNAILYILLNEVRSEKPNNKLTFEYVCEKVADVEEQWEIFFLKNILLEDGYIYENNIIDVPIKITHKGIKFIQQGGYKKEVENRELDNKIKIKTLRSLKDSKKALFISAISVIISFLFGYINFESTKENKSLELKINKQNKTLDSITNVLKNHNKNELIRQ